MTQNAFFIIIIIASLPDHNSLQEDFTALFTVSNDSDLDFNVRKFVDISFKHVFNTTYMSDMPIPHLYSQRDLGLALLEYLSWDKHYKFIISRAYKVLGLIRCTFVYFIGKVTSSLFHSVVAPTFNERYRKNSLSCH